MFPKPTFGANTSSFGSFNTTTNTASPFGFKPAGSTSTFGAAPSFGATATTQQTGGGGLFGSPSTTGGLFGSPSTSTATPAFGSTTGFGLGNTGGGLFGSNTTGSTLFGSGQQQQTGAFGAKPSGFGFASTGSTTGGGLFGSNTTTGGLFGQQNTTIGGGGLFGSSTTGAFGQQQQTGTAHVKYNPVAGTEVMIKSGNSQNINTKHHCITCMKEYESKSLEELRLEDYMAGRKGSTNAGVFGGFQAPAENKPLFGGSTFGQPATTSTGVFGSGLGTGGFGQTNAFSFGNTTQNTNTSSLFGASKPTFGATSTAGGGLFGSTTTQAAPAFGTSTSTFNFGANAQNQSTNLFAKPATSGFGSTPAPTGGFGSFGSTGTNLFGNKPASTATPAFGTTTPAFGTLSSGFGTNTSTSGGLFANTNAFGTKPAPTFGFGTNQQNTGLGSGLGTGLGANTFQNKPGGSVFPSFSTGAAGGGGTLFSGPATQNQAPSLSFGNTLGGGLNTGLGGFGTGNTGLGGSTLGGFNNASNMQRNNLSGSPAGAGGVHEQILTLAARPYGDSPLFKDIVPDSTEDALKPTNPAAVKAVLDRNNYRVASPETPRLRVHPHTNKKSLFDGLEESDASLEDKLSLKPSRKRLVLRMNSQQNGIENGVHSADLHNDNRSSLEDADRAPSDRAQVENGPRPRQQEHPDENDDPRGGARVERSDRVQSKQRIVDGGDEDLRGVNTDLEDGSERHGSWLGSSRLSRNDNKDKHDSEDSSALYPDISKELKAASNSWLRRKNFESQWPEGGRPSIGSSSDVVESSVRELGIKTRAANENDSPAADSEMSTDLKEHLHFCKHRTGQLVCCSRCEKIAHQIRGIYVSEEENVAPRPAPPHPAGVKLTRPGYYTIPSLDEMIKYIKGDGRCVVPSLTIGRKNYGSVHYDCPIDVTGLDLDHLVHFLNKEVIVYPDDSNKPPVGQELNRRAIVTLDRIWPRDKTEKRPITEPERLLTIDYEGKLRRVCDKHDTKFIEYRPETGSWVFRVEHFSKYGLTDSDEEDDPVPQVLRRQLVKEPLQQSGTLGQLSIPTSASTAPAFPSAEPAASTASAAAGLGGLGGALFDAEKDPMFAMQQTSCDLLSGLGGLGRGVLEMDTTEENGETLYPEPAARSFGVKSPTSELARLEHRRSHNVQLMKASLYADTEADDDAVSTATGDQLVPQPPSLFTAPSVSTTKSAPLTDDLVAAPTPPYGDEIVPMKPLVVRPHTVVLRYHRKVPPFQKTIAGRLQASCIADMSVSRARHTRVAFGPAGALVYVTTRDSATGLPPVSELSELERYLRGRGRDDWSEQVVSRVAVCGRGGAAADTKYKDVLSAHLKVMLEHSEQSQASGAECPRLTLSSSPKTRLAALRSHIDVAKRLADDTTSGFGASGAYCYEVWRLCDALWGADLENDGVAGADVQSAVHRYRQFVRWLSSAVATATDEELAHPRPPEPEDEGDKHSGRVLTLLVGGRLTEACRVARDAGDLNMAAIIAQASGDATVRSLIGRQLSLWRECGADPLIAASRLRTLRLVGGRAEPSDLVDYDWLRALNVHARYLCAQVPTLDKILRSYNSSFYARGCLSDGVDSESDDLEVDLSVVQDKGYTGMKYPTPVYARDSEMAYGEVTTTRRVLDLRYELMRARANDSRPKLDPATYTPDPLDYSLSFLLGVWFGCLDSASPPGLAQQLEAAGLWHLAVQALMYHPDDRVRAHLVRSVLSRHAPARADTEELAARVRFLREELLVPERWIRLAQAHRAKYERLPAVEADHLAAAGRWNAAHKVLIEELFPSKVLADDLASISELLERMNVAAQRHDVSGWGAGGEALYHYLHVCNEIQGLDTPNEAQQQQQQSQQQNSEELHARLEGIRPRVAAACRALAGIKPMNIRQAAAHAELGSRLLQLAVAAGEQSKCIAGLLATLALPPDCSVRAQRKVTAELAAEASESCADSSPNSPVSSRRHLVTRI